MASPIAVPLLAAVVTFIWPFADMSALAAGGAGRVAVSGDVSSFVGIAAGQLRRADPRSAAEERCVS